MERLPAIPKPPAASELVADQLRVAIQLGHYLPGDRFPPERELSEQLAVSRTTLREAGRILEAEGLVKAKHGRSGGLVIQDRQLSSREARRLLGERMAYINMVFDFRIAVEAATVRLAAGSRTTVDLRNLQRCLAEMDELVDERTTGRMVIPKFKAADHRFHVGIAKAARNILLEEAMVRAHAEIYQPINAVFDKLEPYMNDPHRLIVHAIEEKDADAAERIMREHIEETRTAVAYHVQTGRVFQPGKPASS
ncbi:FadR/GntR family transcriptional regulator [Arthrobacter bambusae]|uniref:FadR/GntR family transcriptional regulator n=1 Tax=Arthrobacter bambusae TaxID=1338426 RepID=UPI00277D7C2E|nr:FCD domain-containing protein [Arthrobacter bambusae]MDQ0029938.1 DNA-binding FadR family transcriptional regulator [Arthrobacter bambusae]MDQ0097544.1 DNA-binding FadR family transcriptional regulator [Arthrobacter bambusae]